MALVALTLTGYTAFAAAPPAPPAPKLVSRPLTPTEITRYGLTNKVVVRGATNSIQKSAGLLTVGLGQPAYLEVEVATNYVVSEVTWNVTLKPVGSAADLQDSPLGANVPVFEPSDRLVYNAASRKLLAPDLAGTYMLQATVSTNGTVMTNLSVSIVAATYVGVGSSGNVGDFQCYSCHRSQSTNWMGTAHATMFTTAIDGTRGTYRATCVSCHTVGYDTATIAVNGGFDDVQKDVGWTFPTNLVSGNWAAVPSALKQVCNIQCENCHGPGSQHDGIKANISTDFGSGVCAQCHDAMSHHYKHEEWVSSGHAVAPRETSAGCVRCHTGMGFIGYVSNWSTTNTTYSAINCTTCHDPHSAGNPNQLRKVTNVALMNNPSTVITNGGMGLLCMNCHMSRRDAPTYVANWTSGRLSPHNATQADMLAGTNAITYGKSITSAGHLYAAEDSCVTCHMHETGEAEAVHTHAGGHTFRLTWDMGTTDTADDTHLVSACMKCHGPIRSFDIGRKDYDGNGVIEGVQTEVDHLMAKLRSLLPFDPTGTVPTNSTLAQRKAAYNYQFVRVDGSRGVHNTAYTVGLLNASIDDLAYPGDADRDGLLDTWEITNFGSTSAQNAQGDADNDGVVNLAESQIGTNPMLADSDADGFSDFEELRVGADPLVSTDKPDLKIRVYHAGELEFPTQAGKRYQVKTMSTLGVGGWVDVGAPIVGTGNPESIFVPTREDAKAFYRIEELP